MSNMRCETSDFYRTCTLPLRFRDPDVLTGFGCQYPKKHPFYETTSNEYGYMRPSVHTVPSCYYPRKDFFTKLSTGAPRSYKLNT